MKPINYFLLLLATLSLYSRAQNEPRVITFKNEESIHQQEFKSTFNILKINIVEFIPGDFSLYYERGFGEMIGFEMGLGTTIYDYVSSFLNDHDVYNSNIRFSYGLSYSFALRFYPIDLFEEFYIAPEYKFRKYNWERDYSNGTTANEMRKLSLPRINLGYAFFYDNNLLFDYFFGIGFANETRETYESSAGQVVKADMNPRPRFHMGIKIGYAF